MDDLKFTPNILRVLAVMMRDTAGQHYALELVKSSKVSVGSIYATVARLEQHQLLTSALETIDPVAAGRPPRRYYVLTPKGIRVGRTELQAAQRALSFGGGSYA